MSVRVNVRLDDQLMDDCKAWAKEQGVTFTDMIIAGLLAQLQGKSIPDPVIVAPTPSGRRVIKQATDIVGVLPIRTQTIVQHHVRCSCAMCKPIYESKHV